LFLISMLVVGGIASHDLNGDGFPEYFLSNMMANELATLGSDAGQGPRFVNITGAAGIVAPRPYTGNDQDKVSTAWHSQFADLNNDGLVDLFIAKGNVDEMEEGAIEDPNNLLLRQKDGSFREVGQRAGVGNMERSRGAALIDLDLDGRFILLLSIVAPMRKFCITKAIKLVPGCKSHCASTAATETLSAPGSKCAPMMKSGAKKWRSAAATPVARSACTSSAWVAPRTRKSACNGRTASGAPGNKP
jgi:hypothetical protein